MVFPTIVTASEHRVSTLVLMDSWINGNRQEKYLVVSNGFNPCFNGFMDKWHEFNACERSRDQFQPLF